MTTVTILSTNWAKCMIENYNNITQIIVDFDKIRITLETINQPKQP